MIVHILSLNDDDDDAKALPTGVLKDDAMKKGGWGGQNVSKSDDVILVCSQMLKNDWVTAIIKNLQIAGYKVKNVKNWYQNQTSAIVKH